VALTSVHFPMKEIASRGLDRLLLMIGGQHEEPTTEVIDVQLVIRGSTAPPPAKRRNHL
jgi:DNA-binding LacI/PurR family transcriptional regulator